MTTHTILAPLCWATRPTRTHAQPQSKNKQQKRTFFSTGRQQPTHCAARFARPNKTPPLLRPDKRSRRKNTQRKEENNESMPKKRGKNRNWRQRRRNQKVLRASDGHNTPPQDASSLLDVLPDEILFCILHATQSVADACRFGITCRRMWAVFADPTLWRALCRSRYGPIRHQWFAQFGKDAQWVYRAHALPLSAGVGAGAIDGGFYRGDTDGARPHGYGLAVLKLGDDPEGRVYEGEWHQGQMHGHGVRTDKDGSYYEGLWKAGLFHGRGVLHQKDVRYDGEWAFGKRHGRGAQARYVQTTSHSPGKLPVRPALGDGVCGYTGEWLNDKPHGRGVEVYGDGACYSGDWSCGDRHGSGTYVWPNGAHYDGQWVRGKRHGHGVMTEPGGTATATAWVDDAIHGQGVQTCPDGSSYRGDLRQGKGAHGRGVHAWADGRRYEGSWHHNQRHGRGAMFYLDGSQWEGDWREGVRARGATVDHGRGSPAAALSPGCTCMACSGDHDSIVDRDAMSL
ncbi:Morn repeat domain containing protein [Pandoravirus salinus]|uniref:Morn repeat domain containing protein n=1 Tax=Pandoravirus salinus TaxID=1349410 RepID=S4W2E2_9VIRU|nr:morn repeat domain [Pandoravirus salinus]AGO84350.2 Morn repeat domain containing protein [Pandoravirus salinus]